MSVSPWIYGAICAIEMKRADKLLTQRTDPKANVPDKEVAHMPFGCEYGDSASNFNTRFVSGGTY